MGKSNELVQLLKTGNSDAARKLISKLKKTGELLCGASPTQLQYAHRLQGVLFLQPVPWEG